MMHDHLLHEPSLVGVADAVNCPRCRETEPDEHTVVRCRCGVRGFTCPEVHGVVWSRARFTAPAHGSR